MKQTRIVIKDGDYRPLGNALGHIKKLFVVCDGAFAYLKAADYLKSLTGIQMTYFSDFAPNPDYQSIVEGVSLFKREPYDAILAIGGGSAMDVAKCIKLFAPLDDQENYLKQSPRENPVPLYVLPTTAGTGSEATRFAVIYYEGEKQSITDDGIIPSVVFFDAGALDTLPLYQKKATLLDALCHSIESLWSVNSTKESRGYADQALSLIVSHWANYVSGDHSANAAMLKGAYLAGRAINITQTTAGHAMCYKLTSLYGMAHGHAAACCIAKLLPYTAENLNKCIDPRGADHLKGILDEIGRALGGTGAEDAGARFEEILSRLALDEPIAREDRDYQTLLQSVNPTRLKNSPIELDDAAIDALYHQIVKRG